MKDKTYAYIFLLCAGADPNVRGVPFLKCGRTVLMEKCQKNEFSDDSSMFYDPQSIDFIKILLEFGADPNMRDYKGNTALLIERKFSRRNQVVKLLLEFGADPNITNEKDKKSHKNQCCCS